MSKTYIAHLPERYIEKRQDCEEWLQLPVNVSGHELMIKTVIPLTPYTEPDVEQVKVEAFKNGYDAACKDIDVKSKTNAAYRKGLEDAWEAARKIVLSTEDGGLFDYDKRKAVFGCGNYMALKKYTVSEAIEKIRQYEQEQEEKQHTWIFGEVNEPSVDTTLICSKCGYTITIKPGDTQALNFCPKCGDNKNPEEEEA